MKKMLIAGWILILVSAGVKAQKEQTSIDPNTFRLQFFNLVQSEFVPTIEHKFKKTSISVSPVLKYKNKQSNVYSDNSNKYRNEILGFGGVLEFRRYLADINLKGRADEMRKGLYMSFSGAYNYYYATAYVEEYTPIYDDMGNYINTSTVISEKKDEYINFQGAALFGVQEIFYDALVIDFYIGSGIKIAQGYDGGSYFDDIEPSNTVFSSKYSGIIPKAGFSIGFAF